MIAVIQTESTVWKGSKRTYTHKRDELLSSKKSGKVLLIYEVGMSYFLQLLNQSMDSLFVESSTKVSWRDRTTNDRANSL